MHRVDNKEATGFIVWKAQELRPSNTSGVENTPSFRWASSTFVCFGVFATFFVGPMIPRGNVKIFVRVESFRTPANRAEIFHIMGSKSANFSSCWQVADYNDNCTEYGPACTIQSCARKSNAVPKFQKRINNMSNVTVDTINGYLLWTWDYSSNKNIFWLIPLFDR